ncbi:Mitochondrial metalloendopeptidase [Arachis hypogaea]|nr:Mitochondrial metalloendopeptidase [Arachis hypogaea]
MAHYAASGVTAWLTFVVFLVIRQLIIVRYRNMRNPRLVFFIVLVGSGILITMHFWNLETVPYTKRTRCILLSNDMERQLGEAEFENKKASFKGKILPPIHPQSVRIRMISMEIIDTLQRGLSKEQVWSDVESGWHKEDEILDDSWVQQSRKKGPAISHLDGLNWEHFKSDAEIATIIGHEVGHALARHTAEYMTKRLWFAILQFILYRFVTPEIVTIMSSLFLRLPLYRLMEMEADYIGMLLIASAGYDPRVAPTVYEKLGKVKGEWALWDYLFTHPSGRKRAELLSQAKIMEEAFTIYKNARIKVRIRRKDFHNRLKKGGRMLMGSASIGDDGIDVDKGGG